MAAIADKLARVRATKAASREAIEAMGVAVGDAPLAEYAELIGWIGIVPVERVIIDADEITILYTGSSGTVTATVLPDNATDKAVAWSSGNANTVQIESDTGEYRVIGTGLCEITATAHNGVGHSIIFSCY